jgi:hypothetical protein
MDVPEVLRVDAEELSRTTGCQVDLVPNGGQIGVVVKQAPLPDGAYTRARSDVLVLTDFQYPMSAMDMFYMEPEVQHAAVPLPPHATSIETHVGRSWRRWSWHRNGIWKPGTDNLLSHWALIEDCWAKERPA